jgi:hypothetical protein
LQRAQNLSTSAPSAFQNQVASSAQNMGMPEQFGMGSNLANQGGQGALSTAPMALNYGQMGAGIGSQGIGIGAQGMNYGMNAGSNYANQATNPSAVGAYMNPYLQQSLAPQLSLLNQQQALGAQDIAGKATGQGAFGGNRATLAQGLNNQNYALAKQQAIGQGYNQAFNQAQQAQQFGANLGLQGAMQGTQAGLSGLDTGMRGVGLGLQGVSGAQQGYQGATQAGAALGNIGAQQGQYELAKMALQNQIANQQYKQPFENVQFMQSMMGGLPVSASTQQGYQAPPNYLSQLTGLGLTGLGVYGMGKDAGWWKGFGGGSGGGSGVLGNVLDDDGNILPIAKGGQITNDGVKRYAQGGTVGYSTGGDINLVPTDKLAPMMQSTNITPMDAALIQQELVERARMKSNPQTPQIMGGGLDTIPSGEMFKAAGGGIVAFAGDGPEGSVVKTKESSSTPKPIRSEIKDYQSLLESQIRAAMEDQGSPYSKSQALEQEYLNAMKERQARRPAEALIGLGAGIMSGESPYALANIGKGGIGALQQMQKYGAEDAADRKLLLQQQVEAEKSADARKTARLNAMQNQLGQMYSREIGLKNAGATSALAAESRNRTLYEKMNDNFQRKVQAEKALLISDKSKTFDYNQNPHQLEIDAYKNVYNRTAPDIKKQLELENPLSYSRAISGSPDPAVVVPNPAAPKAVTTGSPANKVPPPAAIDMLRSKDSPEMRAQFDAIFGPGAASKALGK